MSLKIKEMKNKVKLIMIAIMAAAFALPAMAQMNANTQQWGTNVPAASFQSTSTMQSSGSAYSTTPLLNADGTALYNGAPENDNASGHPGTIRRVGPPTPEGDPTPVGDGVWVMMLMAMLFCGVKYLRRKQALNS